MTPKAHGSLRLIFLTTLDFFMARLFRLISLAFVLMVPSLLIVLLTAGRGFSILHHGVLALLHAVAMMIIASWSICIAQDLQNGNSTPFRSLMRRTIHPPLSREARQMQRFWIPFSLLFSVFLSIAVFGFLGRFSPLLLLLLTPAWPLLSLLVLVSCRIKGERSFVQGASENAGGGRKRQPAFFQTDHTRPLTVLAPNRSDKTAVASARTNPAGFEWTENNRQALMMDILSGQLNFEDARKRYGLSTEELKSWMKDFLQQNQAPHDSDHDEEIDPHLPA